MRSSGSRNSVRQFAVSFHKLKFDKKLIVPLQVMKTYYHEE